MSKVQLLFGCASLGSSFPTASAVEEALSAASRAGIRRLDTAARYGGAPHTSESLLGAVDVAAQGFTIDTKILLLIDSKPSLTAEAIEASLTESLKILKVPKVGCANTRGDTEAVPSNLHPCR